MLHPAEQWAHKRKFKGYLIPEGWLENITTDKGKPWPIAALVLSDIVFWYTPVMEFDEATGRVSNIRSKFTGDMLLRSASFYAKKFGVGTRTIERIFPRLEELGLIRREMRDFPDENPPRANVPFVEPIPEAIDKITADSEYMESDPPAKMADPPSAKMAEKDIYNSLLLRSKGASPEMPTAWDRYGDLFGDEELAVRTLFSCRGNGEKNKLLANLLVAYGSPDLAETHRDYGQIIGRVGRLRMKLRSLVPGDAHETLLRSMFKMFEHEDFQRSLDPKADFFLPSRILDYLTKVASKRESLTKSGGSRNAKPEPTREEIMEALNEL